MENQTVQTVQTQEISPLAISVIKALQATIAKSPNGVSFIAINGYLNSSNEISNNLLNIGASYQNAKNKDIETLQNCDITKLNFSVDMPTVLIAKTELINSLIKPDQNRSDGQINAYTHICTGLKVHNDSGKLYVWGFRENKTVITKGEYKTVNKQKKTIAKDELKKQLNLRTDKFKQFILSNISTMKLNKETLEF